jgi:hypothetical protein
MVNVWEQSVSEYTEKRRLHADAVLLRRTAGQVPLITGRPNRRGGKILGVVSKAITLRMMLPIRHARTAATWKPGRQDQTFAAAGGSSVMLRATAAAIFIFLLSDVLAKIGARLLPTVARAIPLVDAACRLRCSCVATVRKCSAQVAGLL